MTMQDRFGCEVTLADNQALVSWNNTLNGFLSHAGSTGKDLTDTIEQAPDFALAHATKGLFFLLLGRRELYPSIHIALKTAKNSNHENPVSFRERQYISALSAWLDGKPSQAIHLMELVLEKYPHDPLAMKMSHAIRFMLGDSHGMRRSLENLSHVYKGHEAEGYFLGCQSFALEETGEYEFAEKIGRKALRLAPDDAWGLHAVTHVFDMTGRAKEGLSWISGKEAAWEHCNNFRYHVWWHIALMQLDLGNYDKVLELYDEYIRKDKTDDYRDISNATSVLLRLEFEGIEVGDRWEELSALAASRTQDNCVAFADLHYMMALCNSAGTTDATSLLANMAASTEQRTTCEFSAVISNPGLLAAEGLEAFRDHDFARSANLLINARPQLHTIGGSHAQRDIFDRLAIEASLRAGELTLASQLLTDRDAMRSAKDGYSLSRWAFIDDLRTNNDIALQGAA
ncbi:MAG: tetratricopeptide repeat protein [Pseudomonadota bacterium]